MLHRFVVASLMVDNLDMIPSILNDVFFVEFAPAKLHHLIARDVAVHGSHVLALSNQCFMDKQITVNKNDSYDNKVS